MPVGVDLFERGDAVVLAHDFARHGNEQRFVVLAPMLEVPEFAAGFEGARGHEGVGGDVTVGGGDVDRGGLILRILEVADAGDIVVGESLREEAVGAAVPVLDEGREGVALCGLGNEAVDPAWREGEVGGVAVDHGLQQL